MDHNQTFLDPPDNNGSTSSRATEKKTMTFSFGPHPFCISGAGVLVLMTLTDRSYWSAGNKDEEGYASQHTLYDDLGVELLDHSFEGFNTCIFACESCFQLSCMC